MSHIIGNQIYRAFDAEIDTCDTGVSFSLSGSRNIWCLLRLPKTPPDETTRRPSPLAGDRGRRTPGTGRGAEPAFVLRLEKEHERSCFSGQNTILVEHRDHVTPVKNSDERTYYQN